MYDVIEIPKFLRRQESGESGGLHFEPPKAAKDFFSEPGWTVEELFNYTPEMLPLGQVRVCFPPEYKPFDPPGSFWVRYLAKRKKCMCLGILYARLYRNDPRLIAICKEHRLEHVIFAGTVLRARHHPDSVLMLSVGKKGVTPSALPIKDLTKYANREKYPKHLVIAHNLESPE